MVTKRRNSRGRSRISSVQGFGCEQLEDRRMLAAYVGREILVQFSNVATATDRGFARAIV